MKGAAGLVILASLLAACRPQAKAVDLPAPEYSNSVGPGDVFVLHIVGEDKLPTEFTVAPDGTVDVPYVHRIAVAGLEPQQICDLIKKQLVAEKILVDPSVIVSIKAFNSKRVTVAGEVKEDGSLVFEPGMTLSDAIAKSGGMTPLSREWQVILVRKTKKGTKKVIVDYEAITNDEIPDVPLQAGDKITVPQRPF